jgi:GTPase SAR1 family protein
MELTEIFPQYVAREAEEAAILELADAVRNDRQSRVVLLYGDGGAGKTALIRHLAAASREQESVFRWVEPIDLDDPEYWVLANLERRIVDVLDPDLEHFRQYVVELETLPAQEPGAIPRERLLGYLRRVKRTFIICYQSYVKHTGTVPIISVDTIEAVRGTNLLLTLTQLIKVLPHTLFVLSSRPPRESGGRDRLKDELEDPHQNVPVTTVALGGFKAEKALQFFADSVIGASLSDDDRDKLIHLTQGHPLWMALMIEYLRLVGLPPEAESLESPELHALLPYGHPVSEDALPLVEAIRRRLVTPYVRSDFWHDAIRRLAVVRESVDEEGWSALMADREPPGGLSWHEAWERLVESPWVRRRANGRQITLHDVLAEELVHRVVPLHDQDGSWRAALWRKAQAIYEQQSSTASESKQGRAADLDRLLGEPDPEAVPAHASAALVREVSAIAVRKREADRARAAAMLFQILLQPVEGFRSFLDQFDAALRANDVFLQELLVLEIQRFLAGPTLPIEPRLPMLLVAR